MVLFSVFFYRSKGTEAIIIKKNVDIGLKYTISFSKDNIFELKAYDIIIIIIYISISTKIK